MRALAGDSILIMILVFFVPNINLICLNLAAKSNRLGNECCFPQIP